MDQRLFRQQIRLRHVLLDNAHVGHADQHIAVRVQNGQVHGGICALRLIQMGRVDSRVFAGTADKRAEGIVADATQKLHVCAQPREVLAHVARHTSGGQADVSGIGITQMDGRKGRAVEICIRSADADNIRLLVHEKRLLFSGETVS